MRDLKFNWQYKSSSDYRIYDARLYMEKCSLFREVKRRRDDANIKI